MWGLAILLWMAGQGSSRIFIVKAEPPPCVIYYEGDECHSLSTLAFALSEIDVPAIQVGAHMGCRATMSYVCVDSMIPDYSCADKSRVLLTSEDGKNWCHKIQP